MAKIAPETIAEMVVEYCEEKTIQIPRGFKDDFYWHLGDAGIVATGRQLTQVFCKKIETVLATEPEERHKYGKLFRAVRKDMRWRLLHAIMETVAVLEEFLASLPEGKSWNAADLRHYTSRNGRKGDTIVGLIRRERGQVTLTEIKEVLGQKAEAVLARNPFEKRDYTERTMEWARAVLKEFLKTLRPREKWNQYKLQRWNGKGTRNGNNLRNWITEHRPAWDEQAVAEILGDEAGRLLRRNPFEKRDIIKWDKKRAAETLRWFLSELAENRPWKQEDLRKWKEKGGVAIGERLFMWIRLRYGLFDHNAIVDILGFQRAQQFLGRNPLHKKPRDTWRPEEIASCLREFLTTLPEGMSWNLVMLSLWKKGTNNIGERLYGILRRRKAAAGSKLTEETIKKILGGDESAENLLRRNPFKKPARWNI